MTTALIIAFVVAFLGIIIWLAVRGMRASTGPNLREINEDMMIGGSTMGRGGSAEMIGDEIGNEFAEKNRKDISVDSIGGKHGG